MRPPFLDVTTGYGKNWRGSKKLFSRLYKKFLNNLAGISYNLQKKLLDRGNFLTIRY